MQKLISAVQILAAAVLVSLPTAVLSENKAQPNVLFIAVDDLNTWVSHLGVHPNAKTPHIDRLAKRGVSFARAYAPAPLCNPSRIALLTGIAPATSGIYGNREQLREHLPDAVTLMQFLRAAGFTTLGSGKIFHGTLPYDPDSWDYFHTVPRQRRAPRGPTPDSSSPWTPWGPLTAPVEAMFDYQVATWAISQLQRPHDKPFFLAAGFIKPHLPWRVPQEFFDQHPLGDIALPPTQPDDLDDVPEFGRKLAREVYDASFGRNFAHPGGDHRNVLAHDQWHVAVQAYLATISFADAQVGRLLDALDASEHAANTIVVLWGDHGWHLGEKEHWRKHALWDVTTRTTLVIAAPGEIARNRTSNRPVSLIDLYPTIAELSGLQPPDGLAGQSIAPLLRDPNRPWARPVVMTYGYGNHAVQTERWRYIQYHDGTAELYDHDKDPHEWTNLITEAGHIDIVNELKDALPKRNRR